MDSCCVHFSMPTTWAVLFSVLDIRNGYGSML